MLVRVLRIGFALSLLVVSGSGADNAPTVKCGRDNAGMFWPEAANNDHAVRNRAEKCGTLLYCARTTFGWKWQPMTVSLQSLVAKAAGAQPAMSAACSAEPATAAAAAAPPEKSEPTRQ